MNIKSIIVICGVISFLIIVITLHGVQVGYNPIHQLMSELALGEHGIFMFFAFLSFSIAILFSQQIIAMYKNSFSISILLFLASLSLLGAGIFKLGEYTVLHVTFVAVAFIIIVLSMYLVPRLLSQFSKRSTVLICWGSAICTTIFVALGKEIIPIGIAQRLAVCCIMLWLLWLAIFHNSNVKSRNI